MAIAKQRAADSQKYSKRAGSQKKVVSRVRSRGAGDTFQRALNRLLFTTAEQQALLEDIATLVEDGVPANKAIEVIAKIEKGTKKYVLERMEDKIAQGKAIADGMTGWFSQATVELIRSGEQGGTLAKNIRVAAEALGSKSDTFASLAASLTYPLVVIIAGCAVLIYLNHSVFKQFASIKPIAQWPTQGQQLVGIANFLQDWWWLVIVAIIMIIIGMTYMLSNLVGETRKTIDAIPGLGIYRQLAAARFMETLGLLISNGVVFKQALKILQHKANPYLSWHLMMMEFKLGRGRSNIADVLDTGLVANEDVMRLRAIAEAKGFEHALIRLGKFAGDEGAKTVRKIGKIGGGVLLAIAAMFAGFMVMGLYSVGSSLS